jgi:hypothetical protein
LEVLILHDFKSFAPEVLILGDFKSLFPEVLILVEFKWRRISEMQKIEIFLEVLILGELGRAKCRNGWILMGKFAREGMRRVRAFADRFCDEGGCLRDTAHHSTKSSVMSILSISYSNTMELNLINLNDFAAVVIDRLDGNSDGSLGNVPSVPRSPYVGAAKVRLVR